MQKCGIKEKRTMNVNEIEKLHDEVYCLLEPNASYMSGGNREDVRYFLPVGFLEDLSWLITYIVIPILTNTIGAILAEFIVRNKSEKILQSNGEFCIYTNGAKTKTDDLKKNEKVAKQLEELNLLRQELLNQQTHNEFNPSVENISRAKKEIIEVLLANGLPNNIAMKVSDKIVQVTLDNLRKD